MAYKSRLKSIIAAKSWQQELEIACGSVPAFRKQSSINVIIHYCLVIFLIFFGLAVRVGTSNSNKVIYT